jgi:hypothetical protein
MKTRVFLSSIGWVLALSGCAHNAPPADTLSGSAAQFSTPTSEAWTFQGVRGQLVRTPHYRLFTTERDPILTGMLPAFMETNLARYRNEFGPLPAPSFKLDVFLLRDRAQWLALTKQIMGAEGDAYQSIGRGGFAAGGRSLLWNIGLRDTLALAAHEGWHQYTQRAFRDPLPLWLDEGIATYMEGLRLDPAAPGDSMIAPSPWANLERSRALHVASDSGSLLPLSKLLDVSPRELLANTPEQSLAYYAQVWALALFLNFDHAGEHRAALANALHDAADGTLLARVERVAGSQGAARTRDDRRGPGVVLAYFGNDIDALDTRYRAFIARLLAAGEMERTTRGIPPRLDS